MVSLAPAFAGAAPLSNPVLGRIPAPVTLEYFTALGCPACEQFERDVLPSLLAEAEAGQLLVIVRDLPMREHIDTPVREQMIVELYSK